MRAPRQRLAELRRRRALDEYRLLRGLARRVGYHLVPAGGYSPIPDLGSLPESLWSTPAAMPGVDWDLGRQLDWIERELAPWLPEFSPPRGPPGDELGYHYRNEFFYALDADLLYAIVRQLRPARVLEIGSGYSTLVIERAAARNRDDGAPLRHQVLDPSPSRSLERLGDRIELEALPAEHVPVTRFTELGAGDVLFVDSTHAVRPGGEVVHLLLDTLPLLAPGVVVHLHDFFRPFEYPRLLMERYGAFWQEHHLVQALLSGSDRFEILCANHALARMRGDRILALVPALDPDVQPSSLWLRVRG